MKRILCILALISLSTGLLMADPPKKTKLVVQYKTIHIEKGYDHMSRLKVYIDGNLSGTSTPRKESKPGKFSVPLEKGTHSVRIVMEANYQNNWEEHTRSNGYSIDCLYEGNVNVTKDVVIKLEFDLDKGTTVR